MLSLGKRIPTKWLVRMNKITHVWITTLLLTLANVAVAKTDRVPVSLPQHTFLWAKIQSIVAPKPTTVAKFECRSREATTGQILLQANDRYTVKQAIGKYTPTPLGYRFSDGSLKGQSIVNHHQNIYLVDTKDEATAGRSAGIDAALVCRES